MIIKDTVLPFRYGQTVVGASAVQVIVIQYKFVKGIVLRAAGDNDPVPNTNVIWVGNSSVTVNDGMPIAPGETFSIPLENGTHLYAVSTAASQQLAWWGM